MVSLCMYNRDLGRWLVGVCTMKTVGRVVSLFTYYAYFGEGGYVQWRP